MASPGLEVYNVSDQGLADVYLIQGSGSNPPYTGQLGQYGTMYTDRAPEFFVDQSLYYPPATSYGYICTGFEPAGDWEEHHMLFGADGQDILYNGSTNESVPYLYYAPNHGYGQTAYNPYNPYIPGAVMGVDGSVVVSQPYYSLPSYENSAMPPAYVPMVVQSTPDSVTNGVSPINLIGSHVAEHNFPKLSATGIPTSQTNSFAVSEVNGSNAGNVKQPVLNVSSGSFPSRALSEVPKARVQQTAESGSGKAPSVSTPPKTAFSSPNGLSGSEAQDPERSYVHKVRSKLLDGRGSDDTKIRMESPSQQNRGARLNTSKNQLVVKARTTRAGNPDALGNITIFVDQYNSSDFPTNYLNAKFFVIKSYSEDDVHKSIKYNMWSSTPNGNRKLNAAYVEAQRIAAGNSRSCPIFLFFSVNASGQYCGVAEMIGPVDFDNDMDFWQQDKWSGSFPVKWHFVKDLPNPNFRHIILENNENKPVTNSRDTQEIPLRKGLAMLQIFKSYTLKTSLLDDFMYYENRQQIMHEERTRLLMKSYENPYLVPLVDPPRKLHNLHDFPSFAEVNANKVYSSLQKKNNAVSDEKTNFTMNNPTLTIAKPPQKADGVDELKMNMLSIHSKEIEPESSVPRTEVSTEVSDVVTIGSMPVKVKSAESSVFLTVGTIPLDPRAVQRD